MKSFNNTSRVLVLALLMSQASNVVCSTPVPAVDEFAGAAVGVASKVAGEAAGVVAPAATVAAETAKEVPVKVIETVASSGARARIGSFFGSVFGGAKKAGSYTWGGIKRGGSAVGSACTGERAVAAKDWVVDTTKSGFGVVKNNPKTSAAVVGLGLAAATVVAYRKGWFGWLRDKSRGWFGGSPAGDRERAVRSTGAAALYSLAKQDRREIHRRARKGLTTKIERLNMTFTVVNGDIVKV